MLVLLVTTASALFFAPKPSIVVLGPGAQEVNLIAAKLAAKASCASSTLVGGGSDADLFRARALMYGREYASKRRNDGGKASVIAGVDAIGAALQKCEALIFCCDRSSGPPTDGQIRAALSSSPRLKHVAMLSTMGGGQGGLLTKALAPGEATLRAECDAKRVELSIVRVGNLKGGGPGECPTTGPNAGKAITDYGLSKFYYDGLVDLSIATATMAYDRFTVGAKVAPGDPFRIPNAIISAATSGTFEPCDTDTSRIAAASALLAAVRRSKGAEFSISSAAASAPPTADDWLTMLDRAAS